VESAQPRGDRLLTPAFVLLTLSEVCYFVGVGVIVQVLPQYVVGPVGSDAAGAGLAYGIFAVTALLGRTFAGRLSDGLGRVPLMAVGGVFAALGAGLLPLTDSLPLIIAARLVQGIGEAAFVVAAFAALADIAPPSRFGEAFSLNSLGLYLGLSLGPVAGQTLLGVGSYTTALMGSAAFSAIAVVLALAMGEPAHEHPAVAPGARQALVYLPGIPIALGFFTSMFAIGGFLAFAALYSRHVGLPNSSLALFVYGVVVVVCRVAFAKWPDRLPKLPLGAASLAAIAVGMITAASWQTPVGLLLGVVVFAVGVTFSTPAFFGALFAAAAPHQRGAASGTMTMAIDLGLGFGPIVLGLVANTGSIPDAFAVGGVVALLGALWTLWLARRPMPYSAALGASR
jgi:MFS family permease